MSAAGGGEQVKKNDIISTTSTVLLNFRVSDTDDELIESSQMPQEPNQVRVEKAVRNALNRCYDKLPGFSSSVRL